MCNRVSNSFLLAKLAAGDMIAIEAKYHNKCMAALYNKARSAKQVCSESDDSHLHGIAFAELVAFIEDFHMEQNISPVFKLADLAKLYQCTKHAWKSLVAVLKAVFIHLD